MKLLDLFCKAGGAGAGYARAGFSVTGVDIEPQPHYPFDFVQANAIEFVLAHGHEFDVIHASPPCQAYIQRNKNLLTKYPHLIEPTRAALQATGKPYIIENVEGAPLRSPIRLCGTMFGLRVLRHRLFECAIPSLLLTPYCNHWGTVASGDFAAVYAFGGKGHWGRDDTGARVRVAKSAAGPNWNEAMGIDWMTREELTQAIPPAYTEFIGRALA